MVIAGLHPLEVSPSGGFQWDLGGVSDTTYRLSEAGMAVLKQAAEQLMAGRDEDEVVVDMDLLVQLSPEDRDELIKLRYGFLF